MSIENRLLTAYKHFFEDDVENALIQVSIAIDAYSKKKYSIKRVADRIKKFLNENMEVISIFGTNGFIRSGGFKFAQGDLTTILYKSVRCSLLHEAQLADHLSFIKGSELFVFSDKLTLNQNFVLALILSIIVDDEVKSLNISKIPNFTFKDRLINIDEIHGDKNAWFKAVSNSGTA